MTPAAACEDDKSEAPAGSQRLDKWLWFARVVKSRTLAASLITAGKVRVNTVKAEKPSQSVKAGDVITSTIKKSVRILQVKAPGTRRGPATEAASLFVDLTPPEERPIGSQPVSAASGARVPGAGRPTKRDRRILDRLQGRG